MARPSMAFKVLNMIEDGRSVGRRQLDYENHRGNPPLHQAPRVYISDAEKTIDERE
jgi:hypothetical protein